MTRRTLLATSAAPALRAAAPAPQAQAGGAKRRPSILLISGWNLYNIGDVAITPGFLRLVQRHFAEARVTVLMASYPKELAEYLKPRFPDVTTLRFRGFSAGQTLSPEMESAFAGADALVLNSGMTLSYGYYGTEWEKYIPRLLAFLKARELGVPYGVHGHSFDRIDPPADILYRDVLGKAAFLYTRDSESLKTLRGRGIACPDMAFGPDSTFGFDLRDEKAADAFLRRHELEPGKFVAVIPRLDVNRFRNDGRENQHAAQTVAILEQYAASAQEPLVLVHEVSKAIEPVKTMVYDKLSPAARRWVRYHPEYWMPDAAQAVYARARMVVSMEMHSVILGLAAGTPSIHPYFREAGLKQWMVRDIGLPEWLIDQDQASASGIAGAMLEVHRDTPGARAKVARAMQLVSRRHAETIGAIRRAALAHQRGA